MTVLMTSTAPRVRVRLMDLGLAPENLRFDEPEDADIPRMAETIRAAGVICPPIVRPGRKGERPYMVLDGRRRRFALLRLAADGAMAPEDEVECVLAKGKAAQVAAAVLTNTEQAPVHLADVIVAIGKSRKARMPTAAIAAALGYDELEITRLAAMANVHPLVLQAWRAGRLNQGQVRLFARLKDRERQGQLAQTALEGYFQDYQLRGLLQKGKITVEDERFDLVGVGRYGAAGGRLKSDLFGEMPDQALDPEILERLWHERAQVLGAVLAATGLTVTVSPQGGDLAPDGLDRLPWVNERALPDAARDALAAAREDLRAVTERLAATGAAAPEADVYLADSLKGQLAVAQARMPGAVLVAARLAADSEVGLEATFFWREPVVAAEPDVGGEDEETEADCPAVGGQGFVRREPEPPEIAVPRVPVAVEGIGHGLHEVRTDIATRGLMRALADHPAAALTALIAQLFKQLALHGFEGREQSALALTAVAYGWAGRDPIPSLDGEVSRRLEAWRDDYRASGLRPIGFVEGLPLSERLDLMADLTAAMLNLREGRTTAIRHAARAEAAEIAALCGADLARHWTPDAEFLAAHAKPQLLGMLGAMDRDDPAARHLKKAELSARVSTLAAERRWAPPELGWAVPAAESEPEVEDPPGAETEGDPEAEVLVEPEVEAEPEADDAPAAEAEPGLAA